MDTSGAAPSNFILCPTCSAQVQSDYLIPAGESKVCPNCRDEYLQRLQEGAAVAGEDEYEMIRQEHIKHEASLKSIGILYLLGAIFMIIGILGMGVGMANTGGGMPTGILGMIVFYGGMAALFIAIYTGFRKLKRWVRIPVTLFSALGLLGFPFGTLINGYILYLVWSQKGKTVFSPEYQDVIAATPHVKYRTPPAAWALLILLILGILGLIGYFATSG